MSDKCNYSRSLERLRKFVETEDFKGYDPYDGLNSSLFNSLPAAKNSRLIRLIWIQFFKRSPLNFRRYVGVEKDYNPKALGLFVSGYCNLYRTHADETVLNYIKELSTKILQLKGPNASGASWGYNFDWQARAFFQPKDTPTVVASSFIANALLDAFEITGREEFLVTARSTCDFILNDLNRTYDKCGDFSFSYSPLDESVVFNASLLGSRLLSRVYSYTKEEILIEAARSSVAFCCRYQNDDGSWPYGTYNFHQWVDSFHTGYNLECIHEYMKYSEDRSFGQNLQRGLDYYLATFFTVDGIPRYYSTSTYPIDIHCPAQLIITISKMGVFKEHKQIADQVLSWTIENMQSPDGFFYYQINKRFSSKIPYIRWAQAWMFFALTTFAFQSEMLAQCPESQLQMA